MLAVEPERLAACGEQLEVRREGQELAELRDNREQVLHVVEHEQRFAVGRMLDQTFQSSLVHRLENAEAARDCRDDQRRVRDRGERHVHDAVAEPAPVAPGQLERETCLPHAPAPDERDDPHIGAQQKRGGVGDFAVPAHQRRRGDG